MVNDEEEAGQPLKSVAILLPCFNESATLESTFDRIEHVCRQIEGVEFRYIFVDDGSSDETLAVLCRLREKMPTRKISIIELSRNFGKEAALTAGLDYVNEDACIILDADLQDPPEFIREMLSSWLEGNDVVALRRIDRTTDTKLKMHSARLFYRIFNWLSETNIPENVGDSRLIDRCVIDALKRLPENIRFMKGLFAWVGFKTHIIDIKREMRQQGTTKFRFLRLVLLALNGLTSFSTSLLRIWIFVGLLVSLYAFFHGLYIIIRVLIVGVELPGYASMTVILLFISGIQMVGIGVIGEYMGRTFIEAKRRPSYIVRRFHG